MLICSILKWPNAWKLEMGLDTVKEYLRKLRKKGYIERIGGNRRTGRWVVKK